MTQLPPLVVLIAVVALALGTGLMQVSSGPGTRSAGVALSVPAGLIAALAIFVRPEFETAIAGLMTLVAAATLGIVGSTAAIAAMEPALGRAAARWRIRLIGPAIAVGVCALLLVQE